MVLSVMEGIRQYFFAQCPMLENGRVNIDFLPPDLSALTDDFSLEPTPVNPTVQSYMRGAGDYEQVQFTLSTIRPHGEDILAALSTCKLEYELATWIKEQNYRRNWPELPPGLEARKLLLNTAGYLFYDSSPYGKYQINMAFEYYDNRRIA